jgi:hypothetical protein
MALLAADSKRTAVGVSAHTPAVPTCMTRTGSKNFDALIILPTNSPVPESHDGRETLNKRLQTSPAGKPICPVCGKERKMTVSEVPSGRVKAWYSEAIEMA